MDFPKIRANPNKKYAVGLKGATKDEIQDMMKTIQSYGCRVRHVTKRKDGSSLPYNGLLQINY